MTPSRLAHAAVSLLARGTHALGRGWHWLRHPPGWWDEIDDVYGSHEEPGMRKSAGAAGLGGHLGGGGGGGLG